MRQIKKTTFVHFAHSFFFTVVVRNYEKETDLLEKLTAKMNCYEDFEDIFSLLVETILRMINIMSSCPNETLTRNLLVCINRIIAILISARNKESEVSLNIMYCFKLEVCTRDINCYLMDKIIFLKHLQQLKKILFNTHR